MKGLIHTPQRTSGEQCTLSEISALSPIKIKPRAWSLTHFDLSVFAFQDYESNLEQRNQTKTIYHESLIYQILE